MDVQLQEQLELLFSNNQLLERLRKALDMPGVKEASQQWGLDHAFVLDLMAQIYLHKRAKTAVLVGVLHHHFHPRKQAPTTSQLQLCADSCHLAAQAGFLFWSPDQERFIVRWNVLPEIQEELDRYQFPLPFVVPPKEIHTNRETGYYKVGDRGSLILNDRSPNNDICLDHINRVNKTRMAVNTNVVSFVSNHWRNIDKQKSDESAEEFQARKKAFEKYDRTSKEVIQAVLMAGDSFWLTHRYDHRGRCYSQGYHLQPQGNSWNKACIELHKKELVE